MSYSSTNPVDIYVDGSSRGNPGPSAIGVVIFSREDNTQPIYEYGGYIGTATNNIAEYEACIHALKWIARAAPPQATIHLDSELVYKQITGQYRVKNPRMAVQVKRIKQLVEHVKDTVFRLVPREQNKHANRLAQKASNRKKRRNKYTQEKLL